VRDVGLLELTHLILAQQLRTRLRVSFAKVAEYQARGLIHFHVVIRLDGPDGPQDMPPGWAILPMLEEAIHQAAQRAIVPAGLGSTVLRWGHQLDVSSPAG
jgi:hypothetical protein